MREIKFRAWDHRYSDMIYNVFPLSDGTIIAENAKVGDPFVEVYDETALDHLRVMQYTGLKDKNGVEIYEGDILQRPSTINSDYHGEWIRDEVIYKPGVFFTSHVASDKGKLPRGYTAGELLDSYFDYDGKLFAFSEDYEPACLGEVIGNIYENPELLEAA